MKIGCFSHFDFDLTFVKRSKEKSVREEQNSGNDAICQARFFLKYLHGWHLKSCHGQDGANQVVRCFPVSAFRGLSSLKWDHNCLPHLMLKKMEKKAALALSSFLVSSVFVSSSVKCEK